jgi:putative flavoprotein involved in K+ transport
MTYHTNTIVIGGGQAGLAVGYHLAKRKIPFLILDANTRIGDAWRNRWDSLRLFTPARYVNLPGLKYPGPGDTFPTKDQLADFLEHYAGHFRLSIQANTRVEKLYRHEGHFIVETDNAKYEADQAVVAMADYQIPYTPEFAAQLSQSLATARGRRAGSRGRELGCRHQS